MKPMAMSFHSSFKYPLILAHRVLAPTYPFPSCTHFNNQKSFKMSTKKFIQQFYHDHQDRLYEDAFKTRGTKYYNDNFDLDCQGVRTHNSFTFYQFASRYLQRFPGPPACVILAVQPRKGTKSRAIADLVRTSVTGQRLRNSTPVVAQVLIPQDVRSFPDDLFKHILNLRS